MGTSEIQMQFWTALQESNPTLFAGTPQRRQFFDILDRDLLPLKIRLDIYCLERDYSRKGYLTVCIMLAVDKANALYSAFPSLEGYVSKDGDNRLYILRNSDSDYLIGEDVNEKSIKWFTDTVQKMKEILKKK